MQLEGVLVVGTEFDGCFFSDSPELVIYLPRINDGTFFSDSSIHHVIRAYFDINLPTDGQAVQPIAVSNWCLWLTRSTFAAR